MAATDATSQPVKAQAYRVYGVVVNTSTGNPITGGLTGLSTAGNRQVSLDGAAFANATNDPVEIGTTGYFYWDLTATEATADHLRGRVLASNANAREFSVSLYMVDLSEVAGRADLATVKKPERFMLQSWRRWFNQRTQNRSTGAYTQYLADNTTVDVTGTVTQAADVITVGKSA